MLPVDMSTDLGKIAGYATFFIIGSGFGASLEMGGFGDSRKLAAQFYFKDMTVLKTMFTAILVACVLIFFSSSLGLLDYSKLFVNQTYLWPGIVGGLIMGVGFIVGGYCPGTSIVSAASLKLDGIMFFIGTMIGVGFFGESAQTFSNFWNSSFSERLLVSDWLGWSIGATVFGVAVLALSMFYAAEKTEEFLNTNTIHWIPRNKKYILSGVIILVLAALTWTIGQPDPERKWQLMSSQYQGQISSRDIFIHPFEYAKTWNDSGVKLVTLDFRSKTDFDKFHLDSAKLTKLDDLKNNEFIANLLQLPPQGIVVIVSDNEQEAIKAWEWIKVQGITNLYILDSGVSNWIQTFKSVDNHEEKLDFARPSLKFLETIPKDSYKTKIKLKTSKKGGGLCS